MGEGLTVVAKSADGIIEAVEYQDNLFALGLQWHPERDALSDTRFTNVSQDLSNLPLRALVEHAAIYAAQ
jgi:gamma-glutamyl-gamma-aminobutyrate hydrolase PuuD